MTSREMLTADQQTNKVAHTKIKRIVLTLEQKINAIKRLDQGTPAYKIASEMGVGKTQIQLLRKHKAELMTDYENNVPAESKRRRYLTGNEEINELTLKWVQDAVSRRINVTGPLIQAKALDFARSLNKTDFSTDNVLFKQCCYGLFWSTHDRELCTIVW